MLTKNKKKELKEQVLKIINRLSVAEYRKNGRGKYRGVQLHMAELLFICCFIDALGGYIWSVKANECTFKRFIEKYMPDFYNDLIKKAEGEKEPQKEKYLVKFYSDFRCGLVHEYFLKSGNIKSTNCRKIILNSNKNELKICLPKLRECFKNALNQAIADIPYI